MASIIERLAASEPGPEDCGRTSEAHARLSRDQAALTALRRHFSYVVLTVDDERDVGVPWYPEVR